MELCSISVTGFRRFRSKATLQTGGKLVALVGPNEAGKSSLLQAIALMANNDPPPASDLSRGEDPSRFKIEARYFLSDDDLLAAGGITSRWLRLEKGLDGKRRYAFEPDRPHRDLLSRRLLLEALEIARSNAKFRLRLDEKELLPDLDEAVTHLHSTEETFKKEEIDSIKDNISRIVDVVEIKDIAAIRKIEGLLKNFEIVEESLPPSVFAWNALNARLPQILLFDEDARSLASEYSLTALVNSVPQSLANLCRVAKLDLQNLLTVHGNGDRAAETTIEHNANDTLKERFSEDWQQSGISVAIRILDNSLLVQVVNTAKEFTSFAERSDGLRQFVALQAFTAGASSKSQILLVDEADQKLHYDAQADLVQMLARQKVADKVIYTTHSAGCLPEDMGNGVRLARPTKADETRSEIINRFWAENEPGFAPLLFGMGASTLAFFPTRNAVMVEGAADMLLLPTMFREALGTEVLGFQFVPGLSSSLDDFGFHAPAIGIPSDILYLTDADGGGTKIRDHLIKQGVPKDRVFLMGTKDGECEEFEDFISAEIMIESVNSYISKYYPKVKSLSSDEIGSSKRMSNLEKEFKKRTGVKLPKIDFAYEVLGLLERDPLRKLIEPKRRTAVKAVATSVVRRFEKSSRAAA
jgi:energy-coupling factor transporter ATP-binding protein EcfA2